MINGLTVFIENLWKSSESTGTILFLMMIIIMMSFYEFAVYRLLSRRSIYSKAFHISIMIIPFFIGAIIYALQSNIAITLGTIGALAIIRYRTAVKDPVDMIYILWSVFIGISCGCQLYKLCIITSLIVTVILLLINLISGKILSSPLILVVNSEKTMESNLIGFLNENTRRYKIKSRNFSEEGVNYIIQLETDDREKLIEKIQKSGINRFSLLEYDSEDAI